MPVQSIDQVPVGTLVIVEGGKGDTPRRGIVRFVGTTKVRQGNPRAEIVYILSCTPS